MAAAKARAQAKAAEAEAKAKEEAKARADAKVKAEAKALGDAARAKAKAEAEALAAQAAAEAKERAGRRDSDTSNASIARTASSAGAKSDAAHPEHSASSKALACSATSMESSDAAVVTVPAPVIEGELSHATSPERAADRGENAWVTQLTEALRNRDTLAALRRLSRRVEDVPAGVLEQVEFAERIVIQLIKARETLWAKLQTRSSQAAAHARQEASWCLSHLPRSRSLDPLEAAVVNELRKCLPARLLRSLVTFAHAAQDRHLESGR